MHIKLLFDYLKGRDRAEDIHADGEMILEWILGK